MSNNCRYQAFAACQQTMRQFLQIQEELITQLLTQQSSRASRLRPEGVFTNLHLPPLEQANLSETPSTIAPLPRCIVQAIPQPLSQSAAIRPKGLFLITSDSLGVAPLVAKALEQKGAQTVLILPDQLESDDRIDQLDLSAIGSLQGIVHLAPLEMRPFPNTLAEWRIHSQIHVKGFFRLLQRYRSALQTATEPRILSASLLGGQFGRSDRLMDGLVTGGGNLGLLKTLAIEWPQVQVKVVDCDVLPATVLAENITQELLTSDPEIEVGYPQGQRTIFASTLSTLNPCTPNQEQPNPNWVVFVTGGNRGITAEVLKALVVPGMTLILVGKSPIPPTEAAATSHLQDLAQLRKQLLTQAKAEGRLATPKQLEQDLKALLNARHSRQNLDWFRQHCQVDYHALDVSDGEALEQLVQSVYRRYGRIDCLIHGAGVIEDKLIADKTMESFNRVFDTKIDSAFCLSRYLRPESLKHLVFFASVAGRYGNRGQADYAAANEVITRLAWRLGQQWPTTRVMAIQWGPWDTTGMASAAVKEKFRSQGVIPIPLTAGSQYFVHELLFGSKGDVEIIAGEGPWCRDYRSPEPLQSFQPPHTNLPLALISKAPELQPNSTWTLRHVFSLASDPYLRHHRIDGKPVLPMAGAAEWLAEFVQAAWPDWIVTEILNLQMLGGVVLADDDAALPVVLQAKATISTASSLQIAVDMVDESNRRSLYRASIQLEPAWRSLDPDHKHQTVAIVPSAPLAQGKALTAQIAYDRYLFHGPRFQLLMGIHRLNLTGIDANCQTSLPQDWIGSQATSTWLFDPGLLDLGPQLATIWSQEIHNTYALPTRFGRIVRYAPAANQSLKVYFRIRSHTPNLLTYNAMFITPEHQVIMLIENVESNCTAALNRLASQSSR